MPKTDIDYSSTIIYNITCRDPLIKDLYVGHTTNFVQRKHAHKQSCMNEKCLNYKLKLYETIRNNGNWENWKMEIIDFFECKNLYEARKKEQEYFTSLNATLNSIEPYAIKKPKEIKPGKPIKKRFNCTNCNMVFSNENTLEVHNKTKKHLKKITPKTECKEPLTKFECKECDFITNNKNGYKRHLCTNKHQNCLNKIIKDPTIVTCRYCKKTYNARNSLWYHEQKCKTGILDKKHIIDKPVKSDKTSDEDINKDMKKIMLDLITYNNDLIKNNNDLQKQNQDFQLKILDIIKHINPIQEISL